MVIVGTCIAVMGLIAALFLQSVRLTDEQTLAVAEETLDGSDQVQPASQRSFAEKIGFGGKRDPAVHQ